MQTRTSEETEIEREIFDLSKNNFGHLDVNRFKKAIRKKGLLIEDPRLADLKSNLEICQNYMLEHIEEDAPGQDPRTAKNQKGVFERNQRILDSRGINN